MGIQTTPSHPKRPPPRSGRPEGSSRGGWRNRGRGRGRNRGGSCSRNRTAGAAAAGRPLCSVCQSDEGRYKCPRCRAPYCSVKCCGEHRSSGNGCAAPSDGGGGEGAASSRGGSGGGGRGPGLRSKYLPPDALTSDPIGGAVRRRRMLGDRGGDDDDWDDERDDELDEPGWRITRAMMDRVDASAWLRSELADGGLRRIIADIDGADDAPGAHRGISRSRNRGAMLAEPEMSPREAALERARNENPNFSRFVDRLLLTAGVVVQAEGAGEVALEDLLNGNADELRGLVLAPVPRQSEERASREEILRGARDDVDVDDDERSSDIEGAEDGGIEDGDDSDDNSSYSSSSSSSGESSDKEEE